MKGPRTHRHGRRAASLFFPVLLIIVGIVFLLNNLGVLPWSIWMALAELWPVILILFGLELLLGQDKPVLAAAIGAVVLVAVVVVATVMTLTGASRVTPAFQQQSATVPLGQATSGNVSLTFPAGTVNLGALPAGSRDLVQVHATLPPGMILTSQVSNGGSAASANVTVHGSTHQFWPFGGHDQQSMGMNVLLAPDVPLTLNSEIGAGQSSFDLNGLQVDQLTLRTGAGQTTIDFPTSGQTRAEIQAGVGQLILVIPPSVGVTIHSQGGLVNVQVPSDRFQAIDNGYRSLNDSTAQSHLDLTLKLGVGQVDVR
ncbi:MAG TPA: DUF5668 domain-containing protein [Chloroflexota bacterium]|nr:DUF5668 domain-containing protein [Chloroflexota bacterium]